MRAYRQLFFDNYKDVANPYRESIDGIDRAFAELHTAIVQMEYTLKYAKMQRHQMIFMFTKIIQDREYTLEVKYGGHLSIATRFVQISTELDNPDWPTIEQTAKEYFMVEEGE